MSERGSFVTQFIYCSECLEAVKKVLLSDDKYLDSSIIKNRPIIGGKIGGSYEGEGLTTFELELIPKLEELICHQVRIAVLSDSGGDKIFIVNPILKEDK